MMTREIGRRFLWLGPLLVLIPGATSCTDFPIQSARVGQTEAFLQDYELPSEDGVADIILQQVLGKNNYCAVENIWPAYRDAAQKHEFLVRGDIAISLMPYVWNPHEEYVVEGIGRYVVSAVATGNPSKDNRFVASAEFSVGGIGTSRFADLEEGPGGDSTVGWIDLPITQRVVRQFAPAAERYVHESALMARVYLVRPEKGVVSIDYSTWHELGVVFPGDAVRDPPLVLPIGCLWFNTPGDGRKLLDLRDRDDIEDDYAEMLKGRFSKTPHFVPPKWTVQPKCKDRSVPGSALREAAARPAESSWNASEIASRLPHRFVCDMPSTAPPAPSGAPAGTAPTPGKRQPQKPPPPASTR